MYFPLIVKEALMIEPTESESMESLKRYADVLKRIATESADVLKKAPHSTPVGRVDEALASKKEIVSWKEIDRL
jgi:glycine dehydrogenase subunit 2